MPEPLVSIGLRQAYGSREILKGLDFALSAGEWAGLVGANGAGKTTLFKTLAGLLKPDAGDVLYSGIPLLQRPVEAKRLFGMAMSPDELPLVLTGQQYFELIASARGVDRLGGAAEMLLAQFALDAERDKPMAICSFGTMKKIGIVGALIGTPSVLLLDEPFNGLDPTSGFALKRMLRDLVDAQACSVLMATHTVEMVATWCNLAILLIDGQLQPMISMQEWRESGRTSHEFEMWIMNQLLGTVSTAEISAG